MDTQNEKTNVTAGARAPVRETSLAQILIRESWCKGCAICADFCPKHVFVMRNNLPVIVDLQACNRCMLCEVRCPDFALTVL